MSNWKIKSSEYLLKHKYMTVRKDACETEDHKIVDPYFVLEFPHWVQVMAFDKENRVMITQQYRHGIQSMIYGLPTGFSEKSDKSTLESAQRELLEETGYTATRYEKVPVIFPNPATQNNQVHTFAAFDIKKIKEPEFDHSEKITIQFVTINKLMKMISDESFSHALHIAGVFVTLQHLKML
ncbi:MAG TPA: NUDIX hydrolase, partial [candidate division Zixibacteria bacterium]|nr:NUDIX hydrolase [candidate division Zixibacteria bacterium]